MSPRKTEGPRPKEPSFEDALARLEEIVVALEGGDRPLEESLKLFEEGIALTRQCASRLDHAQRRIDLLSRDARGEPVLVPFDPGGEAADDAEADDTGTGEDGDEP
ncbi:MAG TPA: exodeoxyribonuclease VII small subunit [Candidatus Polarisedimenticolia bacterium]|jgi:exodeoxyribonuclease VII small subunit|nr:exodeoxyribonuclease VII small subunit [Candidatus Polarisedimenticolia bacterium]